MLKTEQEFITENVDENEFLNYIDLVEETDSLVTQSESTKKHKKKKHKKKKGSKHHHRTSTINDNNNDNQQETDSTYEKVFLDLSKYELSNILRKDDFTKTYKVVCKDNKIEFSAKISTVKHDKYSKKELIDLSKEVSIISQMKHPSFLKFIGFSPFDFKKKRHSVIITELTSNGSLEHILKVEREGQKVSGWDSTKKLINIFGIASGMSYLHQNNIIHKDLKPENIFLDDYLFPKIGDFGLSSRKDKFESLTIQSISGLKGSPAYSSPEILQFNQYSQSSDVYSFGFVVYEIITNEIPFNGINNINEIFNDIVNKCKRPKIKESTPESYRKLIEKCWSQNAEERPSFLEIVNLLKNESGFITEDIIKSDYLKYIEFIEKSEEEVNTNKQILENEEPIESKNKIIEDNSSDNGNQMKIVENL